MTERITITDAALGTLLHRWLVEQLQGSDKQAGLYYLAAHGIADWSAYCRTVGAIAAYEAMLAHMNELARTHGAAEETVIINRPGLN